MTTPLTYVLQDFKALPEDLEIETNGAVRSITLYQNKWWIAGQFSQINGQSISQLAVMDSNGVVTDSGFSDFTGSTTASQSASWLLVEDGVLYIMQVQSPTVSGIHSMRLASFDGEFQWESTNQPLHSISSNVTYARMARFNDVWHATVFASSAQPHGHWQLVDGAWEEVETTNEDKGYNIGVFGDHLYRNNDRQVGDNDGIIRYDADMNPEVFLSNTGSILINFTVSSQAIYIFESTASTERQFLGEPMTFTRGVWAWDGEEWTKLFTAPGGVAPIQGAIDMRVREVNGINYFAFTWPDLAGSPTEFSVYVIRERDGGWDDPIKMPLAIMVGATLGPRNTALTELGLLSTFGGVFPTSNHTFFGELEEIVPNFPFDIQLLPLTLAPADKQIRLFWNGEERTDGWYYDDGLIHLDEVPAFGDTILAFRETRWDRSWVEFAVTSPVRRDTDLTNWYHQRLFIFQEFCEMLEISQLLGVPVPVNETDRTPYRRFFTSGNGPFDFSDLPLIEPWLFPPHTQIVVGYVSAEDGENDDLYELTFDFDDSDLGDDEWSLDGDGNVVLGTAVPTGLQLVVERRTRKDRLMVDTQDASRFSSVRKRVLNQQMSFLWEEACAIPLFPDGHPLANRIFPSLLNWVTFTGPGSIFQFDKFHWHAGSEIFVFVNDVEVFDFTLDFDTFTITLPALGEFDRLSMRTGAPLGGGATLFPPIFEEEEDDDETAARGPLPVYPDVERWGVPQGFATVAPFGYRFRTGGEGWQGETGFGPPPGWVFGRGFGYRWDHPDGQQIFIEIGRASAAQVPSEWPTGLGRWTRFWTYTSIDGGQSWSHDHSLIEGDSPPAPAWVGIHRNALLNPEIGLPFGHPLRDVLLAMYNALSDTDSSESIPETLQTATAQWIELLKSVDIEVENVTELTQSDFEDFYDL